MVKKYAKIGKTGKRMRVYAYYAHFLEYGTKKMKKRPFLRPAIQSVAPKIPEIIQKPRNSKIVKLEFLKLNLEFPRLKLEFLRQKLEFLK